MALHDIYRVEIFQNVGSEQTMNVLHLRESVAETESPDDVGTYIINIVGSLYSGLSAELSEDWRVIQISARRVSPTGGIPETVVFGGAEAIVGTEDSEIIPSQVAVLISFYTNTPDRTGRGRMYLPGLPENAQNEGQLLEAKWTNLEALADLNFTNEQASGTGDGRWRYCVHGGGGSPLPDWDIKKAVVRPNLATQRRRRAFPGFAPIPTP